MRQHEMRGKTFELLYDEKELEAMVLSLAEAINTDYQDKEPIIVAVLDGAFIFAADLIRKINIDHQFRFVKLSSYEGMESSGTIKYALDLDIPIQGRNILIIEDIIDTGNTLYQYTEKLALSKPNSIEICTLLAKPNSLQHKDLIPKYCGRKIKDEFVIGYGLDWDYKARNLPAIYQLKKESN